MTQISIRTADQSSDFSNLISGALTGAVLFLSAILLFSQFAA